MTSRQFIEKNFGVPLQKDRSGSSIWADNKGNIYSYGRHYPLLFKVNGITFRNTAGYSNTTSRHIGWCRGFEAIDVQLSGCGQYSWNHPENRDKVPYLLSMGAHDDTILKAIRKDLFNEHTRVTDLMLSKKRKDTAIYKYLESEAGRISKSFHAVVEAL